MANTDSIEKVLERLKQPVIDPLYEKQSFIDSDLLFEFESLLPELLRMGAVIELNQYARIEIGFRESSMYHEVTATVYRNSKINFIQFDWTSTDFKDSLKLDLPLYKFAKNINLMIGWFYHRIESLKEITNCYHVD